MARLFEYQGKRLLKAHGIAVPDGGVCRTAEECRAQAEHLGGSVALKAQVWTTHRADAGLVRFASDPGEAAAVGAALLEHGREVLVEQRLPAQQEFYAAVVADDADRCLLLLLSPAGGSGIEERGASVARLPLRVSQEPDPAELQALARAAGAPDGVTDVLLRLWRVARSCEASSVEINPLVFSSGRWVALDCRIAIDDYAVFRHPELHIEVARELGHEPTALERVAWLVERDDYRGTFYFIEMPEPEAGGIRIGFQGAGGGGSMASLDAADAHGLRAADYTDTSGNPPASKVYRAARIILAQPGLRGYFLSGPGVASQEQFHFARALVKAFREENLSIPAVLRLGGNGEDLAVQIIERYARESGVTVEAYGKDHSADECAARLRQLIESAPLPRPPSPIPHPPSPAKPYRFATRTGTITFDHAVCKDCESKACVQECPPQILSSRDGLPVLNISLEDAQRGKCIECVACEVECWYQGKGGARIDFPIAGLAERQHGHSG